MSEFSEQTVVGHRVGAKVYQPDSMVDDPDEKVQIIVGDVDRESPNHVAMKRETFEKLIEWYEEQK